MQGLRYVLLALAVAVSPAAKRGRLIKAAGIPTD